MATPVELTDDYIRRYAALDPIAATVVGLPGHETELTDYSPAGQQERSTLQRRTLAELERVPIASEDNRVLVELARERLTAQLAVDEAEHMRRLSIIQSPLQMLRNVFELMPSATDDDWDRVVRRLRGVPACLASIRAALDAGLASDMVASTRQAEACALQARTYGGAAGGAPSLGRGLVAAYSGRGDATGTALLRELEAAAQAADEAFVAFAAYLSGHYAPRAAGADAVGEERYRRFARHFTGSVLDLDELYAWGWEEVWSLQRQMRDVADAIRPGAPLAEVVAVLDTDPRGAVHGSDAFRQWAQQLQDEAIGALDGTHFDIPAAIRRIEVRVAPPGSAAAPFYTRPSEDLSRPGRVWYPAQERFPLWSAVSTAYHEGVPGHHLQIATTVYRSDVLSQFRRMAMVSGHSEGWALYAERLMSELGFLGDPAHRLGYLGAQMLRALRVVIDIGLHTGRTISDADPVHGGQAWTPPIAEAMLTDRALRPPGYVASEIVRYLGLPGQAISYKVGERVWLAARDTARVRRGAAFDLAAFHHRGLRLGPLGLDQLARELSRSQPHELAGIHAPPQR